VIDGLQPSNAKNINMPNPVFQIYVQWILLIITSHQYT
jgi:hypothetical protein